MKKTKPSIGAEEALPADVSSRPNWQPARGAAGRRSARVPTKRVTINLDEDIVAIFKADAFVGGPPYQVAINQALRQYLSDRERQESEGPADIVLRALEDPSVVRKIRRVVRKTAA